MEQILRRDDECCTVVEVAERFKVNEETIRGSSCLKPVSSSSVTLAKDDVSTEPCVSPNTWSCLS
jgi:hypothetical protein